MSTITISLPDPLRKYVEEQVNSGQFGNVSEYFRSLIRDAQEKENSRRLDALLIEGLASGNETKVDAMFWKELREESIARLQCRTKDNRD